MVEFIHITAEYSNAVLLAVLPHVSDFAAKLELPISRPITPSQVAQCYPIREAGYIGGRVVLTNGYWFLFFWHGDGHHGLVDSFSSPTNFFQGESLNHIEDYVGQDNMSTNAALALARQTLVKLGWKPQITHANEPPTDIEPPGDIKRTGQHIPFCQFTWEWWASPSMADKTSIRVQVNLNTKQVVGVLTYFGRSNSPPTVPIKLGVEPVLEKDWRRSQQEAGKK